MKKLMVIMNKILNREGSSLLESMIGTAILSVVMVFFASVVVSALLMMKNAYFETQAAEWVFSEIENHNYDSITGKQHQTQVAVAPILLYLKPLDDGYVGEYQMKFMAADGLIESELNSFSGIPNTRMFSEDLFAFSYKGKKNGYAAQFYMLKGAN